uniref:DNA-directed RNA polymerase n=1 Tax=Pseudomuriella schumacherensis TaxID=889459 RepID=A0A140HB25_PSESB|nr:RNA polymerase beta subunit [Pseudomuriella schumacherensis]AMO01374.1 RNA polymerase beta subunit [Pseudomuriella schumacherensis]
MHLFLKIKTNFRTMIQSSKKIMTYNLQKYQRSNQDTCLIQRPAVFEGEWVQSGDLLADCSASVGGELSLGQNIFIAYMPWEGYNYEDAILISERLVYDDVYTSVHIERYELETRMTKYGMEQITNQIPDISTQELKKLDKRGIIKLGSWVEEGDILVGKKTPTEKTYLSPYQKLLYTILEKELQAAKDSSLRAPKGIKAKVIDLRILPLVSSISSFSSKRDKLSQSKAQTKGSNATFLLDDKMKNFEKVSQAIKKSTPLLLSNPIKLKGRKLEKAKIKGPKKVHVYLADKRKIQVGDKMAGRHGNKGIVSQILPRQDMPYLPDGTPIDMVLNPLGVPSRMNVGQIYECLLGLAALYLGENFKILPFDEIYGAEASRSLTFFKLYEAKLKTGKKWLFSPNHPGKTKIFDGRTGETFDQAVTVGIAYMLKLVHLVDDKIHARSTGPYSLVTQQPLKGRSKFGGQRLGEMEVWALEGYGAAFTLLEMLTIKSDDITGRLTLMSNIISHNEIYIGSPESFKVLVCELQALCLDIGLFRVNAKGFLTQIEHLMKLP